MNLLNAEYANEASRKISNEGDDGLVCDRKSYRFSEIIPSSFYALSLITLKDDDESLQLLPFKPGSAK